MNTPRWFLILAAIVLVLAGLALLGVPLHIG